MTRKRPGSKAKKKAAAADAASTSQDLGSVQDHNASTAKIEGHSVKPGHALCPVCGVPIPDRTMNAHLGVCHYLLACCGHQTQPVTDLIVFGRHMSGEGDTSAQQGGCQTVYLAEVCFKSQQWRSRHQANSTQAVAQICNSCKCQCYSHWERQG